MRLLDSAVTVLLAILLVLFCSLAWGRGMLTEVDPYTALVAWSDGSVEEIGAQNGDYCRGLLGWFEQGIIRPPRPGLTLVSLECYEGGPYTGGSCIRGYRGPRAEGYCR